MHVFSHLSTLTNPRSYIFMHVPCTSADVFLCELTMKGFNERRKKLPGHPIYGCFNPTVTPHPKSTDLEVTSIRGSHFLTL